MEDKLDFSLPEKKQGGAVASKFSILLLLILLGLAVMNIFVKPSGKIQTPKAEVLSLSAEQTKELASKLARRNLYHRAAKVWQDYLNTGLPTDQERARTLFQIATLLEKAGAYDEAIEYFYRSEAVAKLDELEHQINTHIKNCFERLGEFSALRYEMMDRTSLKQTEQAGAKIVAEIGAEKITESELDAFLENSIDSQLNAMSAFMTAEQLNEQKKKILEQYMDPQTKLQFLQGWLAQEILYRQALVEQLSEQAEVKKELEELARGVLSQRLMNRELASKIHITETDLQTYYAVNKDKYIEPANEETGAEERQKSFDEVGQQVMTELLGQKRQEVQQEYIKQMMDKYNVIIHTSALTGTDQDEK